jgi:hypothetical protein
MGVAALIALLSTSCFALRGFSFSKPITGVGQTNVLNMKLQPGFKGSGTKDYAFILIGLNKDTSSGGTNKPFLKVVSPKVFDTGRNFGAPRTLLRDDALRDEILNNNGCNPAAASSTVQWRVYRIPAALNDKGQMKKFALTKLGLKLVTDPGIPVVPIELFSGAWDDTNHDGVPVYADDSIGCSTEVNTSMPVVTAGSGPIKNPIKLFHSLTGR